MRAPEATYLAWIDIRELQLEMHTHSSQNTGGIAAGKNTRVLDLSVSITGVRSPCRGFESNVEGHSVKNGLSGTEFPQSKGDVGRQR